MRTWGRWLLIGVMVLGYALAVPARVSACSCGPYATPQEELAEADAVFVGEVLSIAAPVDPILGYSRPLTTFEVSRMWKGPALSHLSVESGQGDGDCGYIFEVGQHYLVYSWYDYGGSDLGTGICSRTTTLERAQEDLLVLGAGQPPPSPIFSPASPFRGLGDISGLSSVSRWNFLWAQQGYSGEGALLGLGAILLAHRGWRWWRARR